MEDATLAQVAAVLARRMDTELPDVRVDEVPTRRYPTNEMAAHLIGYVGEASETQMNADGLQSGAIVGQSGIEKIYNKLLMGEDGARHVVVNSVGREIRTLEELPASEGRRVQLTVDYDLQKAAGRRVHGQRLQRRGGGARSQKRGSARVHQPACLRSERVCGRHRSRRRGRR